MGERVTKLDLKLNEPTGDRWTTKPRSFFNRDLAAARKWFCHLQAATGSTSRAAHGVDRLYFLSHKG